MVWLIHLINTKDTNFRSNPLIFNLKFELCEFTITRKLYPYTTYEPVSLSKKKLDTKLSLDISQTGLIPGVRISHIIPADQQLLSTNSPKNAKEIKLIFSPLLMIELWN